MRTLRDLEDLANRAQVLLDFPGLTSPEQTQLRAQSGAPHLFASAFHEEPLTEKRSALGSTSMASGPPTYPNEEIFAP